MKNIFKKIGYILLFTLISLSPVISFANPGNSAHIPLIHVGGGDQHISGRLSLSHSLPDIVRFETLIDQHPTVFEKPQDSHNSFFSVFGISWFNGPLFVGVPRDNSAGFNYQGFLSSHNAWMGEFRNPVTFETFSAPLQKVNVQGDALATNLVHDSSVDDDVCIDEKGTLVLCANL